MNCCWASRLFSAPAGPVALNLRNFRRLLHRLDGQCLASFHNWDIDDPVDDTVRDTLLGMIWTLSLFLPRPAGRGRGQSAPRCAAERAPVRSNTQPQRSPPCLVERTQSSPAFRRLGATTEDHRSCVSMCWTSGASTVLCAF